MERHDLCQLPAAEEKHVLQTLQARYSAGIPFTAVGDILISINPNQPLPVFGPQVGQHYSQTRLLELPPHAYGLAERALSFARLHQTPQCILVTGESGSGKTECTKMLLAQIRRSAMSSTNSHVGETLLQAMELCDSLGNAYTPTNRNASRHVRTVEVLLDQNGHLIGGKARMSLLEEWRISWHARGERNFNVFYELLTALDNDQRHRLHLDRAYSILEPPEGGPMFQGQEEVAGYKENFHSTWSVLLSLGLGQPVTPQGDSAAFVVVSLLAAILHLGNIHFAPDPETGGVFIPNEVEVHYASALLGVHPNDLVSCLLASEVIVQGQPVYQRLDVVGAASARNCLSRGLYARIVDWLLALVNANMKLPSHVPPEATQSLLLLDPPGLADLAENGFEQLCHNMLAEQFMAHVHDVTIRRVREACEKEGATFNKVKCLSNTAILDLFAAPGEGILWHVSQEALRVGSDEVSLTQRLVKAASKNQHFGKPSDRSPACFTITHLGDTKVQYSVQSFLSKNREEEDSDVLRVMRASRNGLVAHLFSRDLSRPEPATPVRQWQGAGEWGVANFNPAESLSRAAGRKLKQGTAKAARAEAAEVVYAQTLTKKRWGTPLQNVTDILKNRELHLIQCVRPNEDHMPDVFDSTSVARQLRAASTVPLVQTRAKNFVHVLSLAEFFRRYRILALKMSDILPPTTHLVQRVLKAVRIPDAHVGKQKVLLKHAHILQLDSALSDVIAKVIKAQSCVRRCLATAIVQRALAYSRHCAGALRDLGEEVESVGMRTYKAVFSQADQDFRRAQSRRPPSRDFGYGGGQRSGYFSDGHGRRERDRASLVTESRGWLQSPGRRADPLGDFYRFHAERVLERQARLEGSTWGKLLYAEYDVEVAKLYLQDRDVTVDGSYEDFDGSRCGLGVFRNPSREENSDIVRGKIGKGVSLRRDPEGNIWATRKSRDDVYVLGWREPQSHAHSSDVIKLQGRLPKDQAVKVLDMTELRSRMGIELASGRYDPRRLYAHCMVGMSFLVDAEDPFQSPSWICVISLNALASLDSPDALRDVQNHLASLTMKTEQDKETDSIVAEVKERHFRRQWSRTDSREGLAEREASARKHRQELRRQGKAVASVTGYSWEDLVKETRGVHYTVEELQEAVQGPDSSPGHGQGQRSRRRDWAKVKSALKDEAYKELEEEEREKTLNRY